MGSKVYTGLNRVAGPGGLRTRRITNLGGFYYGIITDRTSCEYLRSPLGLDEKAPRFSWQLSSDKKDTLQTAVEIRVREAKTEEGLGFRPSVYRRFHRNHL